MIHQTEIHAAIVAAQPVDSFRPNRDDLYFTYAYQAMPLHGYTRLPQNLLAHPNIKVMLNTDYRDIVHRVPWKHMAYTGPVAPGAGMSTTPAPGPATAPGASPVPPDLPPVPDNDTSVAGEEDPGAALDMPSGAAATTPASPAAARADRQI